jgi:hypothetical protein
MMIAFIFAASALLGNYLPLLGESAWLLTFVFGALCALGVLDAAAQPAEYAHMLGKSIDKKAQEGYRTRRRWLALAIVIVLPLTMMCLPYLDVPVLMLVSFVLGRVAALAYCRQRVSTRDLILWTVVGTASGTVPSMVGWSVQSLPFLAALRPSLAMGTTTNSLALCLEVTAYLLPCIVAIALIALTRPKTVYQLDLKYGSS